MTGYESKRVMAQDKLEQAKEILLQYPQKDIDWQREQQIKAHTKLDDDDAQVYIADYEAALRKEYQRGYGDGKAAQPVQEFGLTRERFNALEAEITTLQADWLFALKEVVRLKAAQRPWVDLTDEEAQWLYDNCRTPSNLIDMVETMLKEKNT